MVSGNQINAMVPVEVGTVTSKAAPGNVVTITVTNGVPTAAFQATAVDADPGVFSFDGLGKGQAAVLNYDDATRLVHHQFLQHARRPRSSTILIYATGLGDVSDATIVNGEVATGATAYSPPIPCASISTASRRWSPTPAPHPERSPDWCSSTPSFRRRCARAPAIPDHGVGRIGGRRRAGARLWLRLR